MPITQVGFKSKEIMDEYTNKLLDLRGLLKENRDKQIEEIDKQYFPLLLGDAKWDDKEVSSCKPENIEGEQKVAMFNLMNIFKSQIFGDY